MSRLQAVVMTLMLLTVATASRAQPAPQETATSHEVRAAADYRLGADDKVHIIVYGETDLSGDFQVTGGANGQIAFPLIGQVRATGLTVSELSTEIADKLRDGYLKDPRVSVEVTTYRPFYILGEVTRPGEYPYTNGLTVLNAVATANGFTYRANSKRVFIKHAGEAAGRDYPLTSDSMVEPGDTIRISERFF